MERRRFPLTWFAAIFGAVVVFMFYETLSELSVDWPPFNPDAARAVLNNTSRANNTLVQIVLLSVALAIPITANNYTPKLVWLFLTDPVNQIVLSVYAASAANGAWTISLFRDRPVPVWIVDTVALTSALGFLLAVPYFFYVIWFIDPNTVIQRLEALAVRAVKRAPRSNRTLVDTRASLPAYLYQLGSVTLKSIDRVDRQSATEAISAIRRVISAFAVVKKDIPSSWFRVTKKDFRGLSREALMFIGSDRGFVEVVALQQLMRALDASLSKMPDAVSAVADAARGIGVDAVAHEDHPLLGNVIRTFNTFLRSVLRLRAPEALYDVLHQYLSLAEDLAESQPDFAAEIATHVAYYGREARSLGAEFTAGLFAHDLGAILRHAVQVKSAAAERILETYLDYLHVQSRSPSVPLAVAALITTGSIADELTEAQRAALLARIGQLPVEVIHEALSRIASTDLPRHWELTDHQVNLNFLPPPDIERLQQHLAQHMPGQIAPPRSVSTPGRSPA